MAVPVSSQSTRDRRLGRRGNHVQLFCPAPFISRWKSKGPRINGSFKAFCPTQVTHTVLAYYFGAPVPRWADEGGAVLSEDDLERSRHDAMVRQILNARRAIPMNRLFALKDYPNNSADIGALYAQGYSIAEFLVYLHDRQTFLAFVGHGMQYGWDSATRTFYRYQNVNELEQAWLSFLREGRRPQNSPNPGLLAKNTTPVQIDPANRVVVRIDRSSPWTQPLAER